MKKSMFDYRLWSIFIVVIALILAVLWLILVKFEGKGPVVEIDLNSVYIGKVADIHCVVKDSGSGIRKILVVLIKNEKEYKLYEQTFPAISFFKGSDVFQTSFNIYIEAHKKAMGDGEAVLRVGVWDYSWRGKFHGNKAYFEKNIIIDTKAPDITVLTQKHYVNQGGTGVVIYKLSEGDTKNGVFVGENFFPGHSGFFKDENIMMAFYGLSYLQGKGTIIFINAEDVAGNKCRTGFIDNIKTKKFKTDKIRIPDSFLNRKMPSFDTDKATTSMLEKFLVVNRELRKVNSKAIKDVGKDTDNKLYWSGKFKRLSNAANRAGFADHRKYYYNGEVIDKQIHMGVDLASLKRAPIPAGNNGRVAFTGDVGIYGKTVIIDHGFGLFSSYSHLSQIKVKKGDMLKKGDILGKTGTTGLAGGDHLHYGMFVGDVFVDPKEWWDLRWIKNNIISKINNVKEGL